MRHISFEGAAVDPEWLAAAGALLVKLDAAAGAAERAEIIDGNSALWGSLKPWLLEISHQKCWFSEAKDCFSHWDVEHYRPKSRQRISTERSMMGTGGFPSTGAIFESAEMSVTV